jgi:O-antigen/teichoic acid export membrane protein
MADNNQINNNEKTYDHVLKYTGLFGGVQGLAMLMGLARNKLVALLIGPAGLGFINMYNSVASLIHQSTNLGLGFSAVKHMSELSEDEDKTAIVDYARTVRTWCFITALFGMLLCCLLSRQISLWSFGNYDYAGEFCVLSPIVAMMAVVAGEMAIMKGLKQLKRVAMTSACGAFATLLVCIPVYSLWGMEGIVLSLVLCNASILLITLFFSCQIIPWQISLRSVAVLASGLPMVRLGIGYIIAGVFGQGAEYVIRTMIQEYSDIAHVGFYNCGYIMTVSYASMVFVAIEADFFPRLSAACKNVMSANRIINQQIEICVLLISPVLIGFVISMPYLVQILYSYKFQPAVPMAISATMFMFFRALTLPVAYLALARGDSKMFMITELVYDVFIALAVPAAFKHYGLMGAGWAISIGGFIYFLLIHILYRFKYGYVFSSRLLNVYLLQFLLLAAAIFVFLYGKDYIADFLGVGDNVVKWIVGVTTFALSALISLRVLRRETNIINSIRNKFKNKFGSR